jgi:2-keto-4-pentenoate hydratase/2-oxohepta-3-ene-1,7-dioic acid hydratase in catechol pathway
MRLATYQHGSQAGLGMVIGAQLYDLAASADQLGHPSPPADMLGLINDPEAGLALCAEITVAASSLTPRPLATVRLLAPIPRPRQNVLCVGRNYLDHIAESGPAPGPAVAVPDHPMFFTKRASSVVGPEAGIPWRADLTADLDWEAELGIVIGTGGRDIAEADAHRHIFGLTCINDVSARDVQIRRHGGQYFKGKSLDGSCPMGPWIVTWDEFDDPPELDIACRVNGTLKQSGNTRDLIFSIARIISELSAGMTLEAGDIIASGTPDGVGVHRKPAEALAPGDVVEVEIASIGILRNHVADAGPAPARPVRKCHG